MQITKDKNRFAWCLFLLGVFFFIVGSCNEKTPKRIAFYHWKSQLNWSASDAARADALSVNHLYIRYFDWKMEGGNIQAVAPTQFHTDKATTISSTAVVFIENNIFRQLDSAGIADFADTTITVLNTFPNYKALQIDCDWTAATRNAFFQFLYHLKIKNKDLEVSTTLRLHQWKDREAMGIPPVDKVTLMYYNMGEWSATHSGNSILDNAIGTAYLKRYNSYPLDLEIALPLFGWLAVERHGEIVKLIRQTLDAHRLDSHLYQKINNNKWQVQESHYLAGDYVYKNDILRLELPSKTALIEAADMLKDHLDGEYSGLVFYHWQAPTFQYYSDATIQEIIRHLD